MSLHATRKGLLKWGVGGGATLLLTGAPTLPARASSTDAPPPDGDLAYLRLLVGAELLAIDFHRRVLAAKRSLGTAAATFARALADERAHYARLARALRSAGQTPAAAGDVDFRYPRGTFATPRSIARLGWRIESLLLGAYLGAIETVETPDLRLPLGQIAANEAQHMSALAPLLRKRTIGVAFPPALAMSTVSATLDGFES